MSSSLSLEFNGFQLPFPESFGTMGVKQKAQLNRWRRLLSKLSEEVRAVEDTALGAHWEEFRAAEPSKSAIPGLQPDHLVSPGGVPDAGLCLVLHYPTFNTKKVSNGQTFDESNTSIARLVGSGFNAVNSYWLDIFCRRRNPKLKNGKRFNPREHAEPSLLQHHLEWFDRCLRTSVAKVVCVFGKENEKFFKQKWGNRLGEMKLWGDYKDVSLWLLYPEGDDYTRIERLVLFVWHPEYVGQKQDLDVGQTYDLHLGLAAQLAGIVRSEEQIHFQETSVATPEAIQRRIAAADGDQFAVIRTQLRSKRKTMMTIGETPVGVACPACGCPRLNVQPCFIKVAGRPALYVQPHVPCPNCKKQQFFVPIENIPFTHPNELSPGRGLFKEMGTFTEGSRLSRRSEGDMVLQAGMHAPVWVPGSEVYVRAPRDEEDEKV